MTIEGQIVDAGGNPLSGVMITALGTPCYAYSEEDGRFQMSCPPGTYDLTIGQAGHITSTIDQFAAPEFQAYDLGRNVLIRIPQQKGFLLFDDNDYTQLLPGQLRRQRGGGYGVHQYKWYCLDKDASQANTLTPGRHRFFDNEAVGWRPFKLDKDGCAYRMSPVSNTRWGVDYNEKAEYEERELEEGKALVEMLLEEGEYFIADWQQGFFTKVEGHKDRFSGSWIVVE